MPRRRKLLLAAGVAMVIAAIAGSWVFFGSFEARFERVGVGMSLMEVRAFLGSPSNAFKLARFALDDDRLPSHLDWVQVWDHSTVFSDRGTTFFVYFDEGRRVVKKELVHPQLLPTFWQRLRYWWSPESFGQTFSF